MRVEVEVGFTYEKLTALANCSVSSVPGSASKQAFSFGPRASQIVKEKGNEQYGPYSRTGRFRHMNYFSQLPVHLFFCLSLNRSINIECDKMIYI